MCRAIEQWEPRTETVAVHAWLHPWLPYLGSRMDELYPNIRFKLSAALQQWHPSDQSALALLRPWHTVMLWTPHPPVTLYTPCSCMPPPQALAYSCPPPSPSSPLYPPLSCCHLWGLQFALHCATSRTSSTILFLAC